MVKKIKITKEDAKASVYALAMVVELTAKVCPEPIAACVLNTLVSIYTEAMKVAALRDKLSDFGAQVCSLSDTINRMQMSHDHEESQKKNKEILLQLETLVSETKQKVDKWTKHSRFHTWFYQHSLKKELSTCTKQIQEMSNSLEMTNLVVAAGNRGRSKELYEKCQKKVHEMFAAQKARFSAQAGSSIPTYSPQSTLQEIQRDVKDLEQTADPYIIGDIIEDGQITELCAVMRRPCDRAANQRPVAKRIRGILPDNTIMEKKLRTCIEHFNALPPHPNIMKMRELVVGGTSRFRGFCAISEYHRNGNLSNYCKKEENRTMNVFKLLAETAEALVHMHKNGVAHGSVRGANILISDDGAAVVHDFELCRFFFDLSDYRDMPRNYAQAHQVLVMHRMDVVGRWVAPEIIMPFCDDWASDFWLHVEWQTPEGDVWSFGMLLLELCTGRRPYNNLRGAAEYQMALYRRELPQFPSPKDWERVPWMTQEVFDLMLEMVTIDWEKRPSMEHVAKKMREFEKNYVPRQETVDFD